MSKISQLPLAEPLSGAEQLEAVQNGKNVRFAVNEIKGKDGLSAYELAVRVGYTGTEAEWLESIKGVNGNRWYVFHGAPDPSKGNAGDYAIDRVSGKYYLKHGSGLWIYQGPMFNGSGGGDSFIDVPADGLDYVRRDGTWKVLERSNVITAPEVTDTESVMSPASTYSLLKTIGFVKDETSGAWLLDSGVLPE